MQNLSWLSFCLNYFHYCVAHFHSDPEVQQSQLIFLNNEWPCICTCDNGMKGLILISILQTVIGSQRVCLADLAHFPCARHVFVEVRSLTNVSAAIHHRESRPLGRSVPYHLRCTRRPLSAADISDLKHLSVRTQNLSRKEIVQVCVCERVRGKER